MADRSVMVRIKADANPFVREMAKARAAVKGVTDEIDTTNDRTAWMAQGFLSVLPALAPLGAAAVPLLSGMATQATLAATAASALGFAFVGVGDALQALNEYQLEPTSKNLEKLSQVMADLGPDGADFVRFLDDAGRQLSVLQLDARAGMFPGMTDGIDAFLDRLPEIREVISSVSQGIGQLSHEAGEGLASEEFDRFFEYLRTDAQPTLLEMGRTLGNLVDGFGSMLAAFGPVSRDFSAGMLEMSRQFEAWAEGLEGSQDFNEFLAYVQHAGPMAIDLLSSLADALVEITKAAAPVGDVLLPVLTGLVDGVALLAGTPVGSLVILTAALTSMYGRLAALQGLTSSGLLGRSTAGFRESVRQTGGGVVNLAGDLRTLSTTAMTAGARTEREMLRIQDATDRTTRTMRGLGRAGVPLAGLGIAATGVADQFGLANTASMAMMGTVAGPWGAAIGGAVGLLMDFQEGQRQSAAEVQNLTATLDQQTGALTARTGIEIVKMIDRDFIGQLEAAGITIDQIIDGAVNGGEAIDEMRAKLIANGDTAIQAFTNGYASSAQVIHPLADKLEEKLGDQNTKLKEAREEWRIGRAAADAFAGGVNNSASASEQAAARMQALRDSARATAESFHVLGAAYEAPTMSLRDFLRETRQAADAQKNLGKNIGTLVVRGVDPVALEELVKAQGLNAGLILEELVNGPQKGMRDFAEVMAQYGQGFQISADGIVTVGAAADYARGPVAALSSVLEAVPEKVATEIRAENVPQTIGEVDALIEKYPILEEHREALVSLIDEASGPGARLGRTLDNAARPRSTTISVGVSGLTAALGALGGIPGVVSTVMQVQAATGNADGGTVPKTGLPYADRHRYLLADGEEVISNRNGQADQYRPALKAINSGASREVIRAALADGGTAGLRRAFEYQSGTAAGGFGGDRAELAEVRRSLRALVRQGKTAPERTGQATARGVSSGVSRSRRKS